jgi:predicted nucleic acid-binding Zn ribbon protein
VPTESSDLARSALAAARTAARRSGAGRPPRVAGSRSDPARSGYSGSAADPRDPQKIGSLVRRLVADRGWEETTAAAAVMGRWEQIVGADIASHAQPSSLRDGELVLVAESTAWATQLRLLAGRLQARLSAEVGSGVVTRIRVHGPSAPSWRRGPRRVAGRGPRDTYG